MIINDIIATNSKSDFLSFMPVRISVFKAIFKELITCKIVK